MSQKKKLRQFDRAFKVEAVHLVREEGRSVAAAARDLGISEDPLHRWKQQFSEPRGYRFRWDGPMAHPQGGWAENSTQRTSTPPNGLVFGFVALTFVSV